MFELQYFLIGIIQGVTEFLPISSSGHLVLFGKLTNWEDQGLFTDISVHFGTLFAVIVYLRKDIYYLLSNIFQFRIFEDQIIFKIILATLPAILLGYFIYDYVSVYFRSIQLIAISSIVFAIILLALMKLLAPNKLFGYTLAFFTPGFFKKKVTNNTSFYTPFNLLLFLFSSVVIALFLILIINSTDTDYDVSFLNYLILFSFSTSYLSIKYFLNFFLSNTLGLSPIIKYFLVLKSEYLNSLCLLLLPIIIVYQYAFNSVIFLLTCFGILFIFRGFLILKNNKKIVLRKLFYFILYFCTLEIAPLLIVYKITTTT